MMVEARVTLRHLRSRRGQRVAWAGGSLAVLLLIGGLVSWRIHKENEPEAYTPGEASVDVTSVVSEAASRRQPPALPAARVEATRRQTDPLVDLERKLPAGAPEPRFTDVTAEAGLSSFRQFSGARTSQLPEDMGSGVAWGDFDNDGFDDLFVASGGGPLHAPASQLVPSVLYRNLGNGHFEAVQGFPETRLHGMGAAWGDYNNDGWLDLVVTAYDAILLFRNDRGHLVREKRLPSPKGFWAGATWGDFNRDGYPDLYVCGYLKYVGGKGAGTASKQFGLEVPFTLNPASFEPERNLLFRNNGDGTFTEAARALGVDNREGRSLSALWHDFDGNGWLDLYVANDVSENKLFLNSQGRFVDAGRSAWVEEYRGSMGLATGDFDRDGDDDLFISHWIAQQYALYQSLLAEQRYAGAKPELHFTDVAEMRGVGQPSLQRIGWGAAFVDFDSDGWPDLVAANGSTFEDKQSSPRRLVPMPSFLFWNARGEFFHDLAPWNRSLGRAGVSRGLAVADFDNDGAMDIAIVDHGGGLRLLRNDVPQGNWIEFRLHSRLPPGKETRGFGDAASVVAWVNSVPLRRTVSSASYLSQDSRRVHIGLGAAVKVDRLEISWMGGRRETWTNIEANRIWDVTEGARDLKPFVSWAAVPVVPLDRSQVTRFWELQRSGMDAMKRDSNLKVAELYFREALTMNPRHEDSHYYLANCLAAQGDVAGAITELNSLIGISPQSHRAVQRKGELQAAAATSRSELEAARQTLQQSLRLNSEETGTLMLLGEVSLALGHRQTAEREFAHVCQANSKAANAWFLRGYIAWATKDSKTAVADLSRARESRGKDWKPAGAALEGDVKRQMFREAGFLNVFEKRWNGRLEPSSAYAALSSYLHRGHAGR